MVRMDSHQGRHDGRDGKPREKPNDKPIRDQRAERCAPTDPLASTFGFEDDDRWLRLARSASTLRSRDPEMLGPYRVLLRAGAGGQGTVFKVLQPVTGRAVALKRLSLGAFASTKDRVRFQRELSATATLQHPGIVTLLGHDEIDGQPVLLMEWIEGQPIDLWAMRASQRDVLTLFAKLCDAVAHAHRKGVLHRDLKPSNVLVVRPPDSPEAELGSSLGQSSAGEPKVLDFGLSRLATSDSVGTANTMPTNTMTEGFLGTPAYASPEQASARWQEVDTRSDVYAIGVMLYEALTGERPFSGDNIAELLTNVSQRPAPRPSLVARRKHRTRVDGELDAIVLKAIAKNPAARYQSADAFASDLRRKLSGQAVLAHPPKLLYQTRALARQHWLAVSLGMVGLVGILTLAVVSTILASRLAARGNQLALAMQSERAASDEALRKANLAQAATLSLLESLGEVVKQTSEAGIVAPSELIANVQARLRAGEFAGLPEAEVSLWSTLATLAFSGRDVPLATAFADEAAKSLPRVPLSAPARADYLNVIGLLHENRGDSREAQRFYSDAHCINEPARGKFHPQTLRVLANLAGIEGRLGNHDDSVALAGDLIERRIVTNGPEAIETASAWAILAANQRRARNHEASRHALDTAFGLVDWSSQARRAEAQRVAREVGRRASIDGDDQAHEWALRLHAQVEPLPKGLGTKVVGAARADLADMLRSQGRTDEALRFAQAGHDANLLALPSGHADRARSAVILSECLAAVALLDASATPRALAAAQQALIECDAMTKPDKRLRARAESVVATHAQRATTQPEPPPAAPPAP
jgi:serine/threonine protein kinase